MEYRDNGAFYRICGDVIQVWETVTWTVYFMHSTTIWPRPSKFFVLFFCFICRGKWQPGIKAEQLTMWTLAMPRPRSSVINSAICRKVWTSFSLQILCVPSRTHLLPTFKKFLYFLFYSPSTEIWGPHIIIPIFQLFSKRKVIYS